MVKSCNETFILGIVFIELVFFLPLTIFIHLSHFISNIQSSNHNNGVCMQMFSSDKEFGLSFLLIFFVNEWTGKQLADMQSELH